LALRLWELEERDHIYIFRVAAVVRLDVFQEATVNPLEAMVESCRMKSLTKGQKTPENRLPIRRRSKTPNEIGNRDDVRRPLK